MFVVVKTRIYPFKLKNNFNKMGFYGFESTKVRGFARGKNEVEYEQAQDYHH